MQIQIKSRQTYQSEYYGLPSLSTVDGVTWSDQQCWYIDKYEGYENWTRSSKGHCLASVNSHNWLSKSCVAISRKNWNFALCFVDDLYQFFKSFLHISHPMEVFALLNICSVSLLSLVLDFQLVAQELSLRVLQTTDEKWNIRTWNKFSFFYVIQWSIQWM